MSTEATVGGILAAGTADADRRRYDQAAHKAAETTLVSHLDTDPDGPEPCPDWCHEDHAAGPFRFDCHSKPAHLFLPGQQVPFASTGLYRCDITGESSVEVFVGPDGLDPTTCADLSPEDAAEFAKRMAVFSAEIARYAEQLRAWKAAGNR